MRRARGSRLWGMALGVAAVCGVLPGACAPETSQDGAPDQAVRSDEGARAVTGPAASGTGSLALRISTAAGGAAPPGVRVCVVDPAAREVVARADGGRLTASRRLRTGDVLRVWAPGHDVATRTVTSDGWPSDVTLVAAAGAQHVRVVDGATGVPIEADVTVVRATPGRWSGLPAGAGGAAPEFVAEAMRVPPEGTTIVVPAGLVTTVRAGRPGCFAYPWFLTCRDGGSSTIRVERLRSVALRCDGKDVADPGAIGAFFVPDRAGLAPGDPLRDASVAALLDTMPPPSVAVRGGACFLDGVPPVAGRVFASVRGRPGSLALSAGDTAVDLRRDAPLRRLTAEPRLGGEALGEGGLVAPGRLDWIGAATLASLGPRRANGAFVVRDRTWEPASLPSDEWITLWHPDRGIAHVRWGPDDSGAETPLEGDPGPGLIEVTADGGASFAAWVIAWPVGGAGAGTAPAGGGLVSRPGVRALRRECDGVTRIVLRGLPLGAWRVDYGAGPAGRRPPDAVESLVVTLTAAAPQGRVVVRRRE